MVPEKPVGREVLMPAADISVEHLKGWSLREVSGVVTASSIPLWPRALDLVLVLSLKSYLTWINNVTSVGISNVLQFPQKQNEGLIISSLQVEYKLLEIRNNALDTLSSR